MKYSCNKCNSGDVQKISVLLASGTQKTVTQGMGGASMKQESDLVRIIQNKLEQLEHADKELLKAYKNEMDEHVRKMSNSIDAPELDRFDSYAFKGGIIVAAFFFLGALFTQSGFSIFGVIVSALVSVVVFFIASIVLMFLSRSSLMNFVQPQLAEVLDKQEKERENAKESARKSGPTYPTFQSHGLRENGFFCHTCGEVFIP